MMKTYNVMLSLVMAMTMMSICPATMWAQDCRSNGHSFDDLHDPDHTVCTRCGHCFIYYTTKDNDELKRCEYDDPDNKPKNWDYYDYTGQYICNSENTTPNDETGVYVSEFNSLTEIGINAFRKSNVVSVILPNTVERIERLAFVDCKNLEEITFGSSLQEFEKNNDEDDEYGYAVIGVDPFNNSRYHKKNFRSVPALPFDYHNISIELTDQSYVTDNYLGYDVSTVRHASYKRIMPNKWGTIVLPLDVYRESDDYDIYKYAGYDSENNELKLTRIKDDIDQYMGTCVLIRMSEKTKNADDDMYHLTISRDIDLSNGGCGVGVFVEIDSSEEINGLKLTGTYQQKEVKSGYIIANNAFWNVESLNDNVYCEPFRGYLAGTPSGASSAPERLGFAAADDADVSALETLNAITSGEAQYFDLDGHPLSDLQDGVNIVKRGGETMKVILK